MSRRTIGGGRVLGSGANLLPPSAKPSFSSSSAAVRPNLTSPTASSVSLPSTSPHNSGTSTPPTDPQDISSRISLDHIHNDTLTPPPQFPATDRLVCPICNDEMVTLLQLNRHLDDVHQEIEEERQDEAKDWFRQRLEKAKRFQPLAVLNQKLRGLEGFVDSVDGEVAVARRGSDPGISRESAPPPPPPPPPAVHPDEVVRKDHWQRRGDACSEPTCGKRLNTTNGAVNCRHCGRLFCDEHTLYRMRLSRSAQHDPIRGDWLRVCETCYKSRVGYNDRTGFERNHMPEFAKMRRAKLDKTYLEVSRLEKRLTRLTQLLADPPDEVPPIQAAGRRWSLAAWGQNDPKKALEQSVVAWEDDATVPRCPYCQQDFSQYTFRRHHCRTCGKVVCGDPQTGCSRMLGLNVATTNTNPTTEKSPDQTIPLDIRICKDCNATLFSRRDFESETKNSSPLTRLYQNQLDFERGIRMLMPRFQKLLSALQDPDQSPTSAQITDASKTRKRLLDSFTQYDIAARRIRDLPTLSPTQQKLQKSIYTQASQFLHLHMLPLKTLPKILKHAVPSNGSLAPTNGTGRGALASIHRRSFDSSSQISSAASSQISAMEAEEKSLRERLIVLEEQRFFVSEMVNDAKRRRKFDEVQALSGNAEDLSREIDRVQNMLGGLDFEGAYNGTGLVGEGVGVSVKV